MPPSTNKRVILYRWDRQPLEAIINPAAYLIDDRLEWITPDGKVQSCLLAECKVLCFVSETGKADLFTAHNLFERRPRVPGLWTRFTFRDGHVLDGILSPNLLEWPTPGYLVTPPQPRASRHKVFIPRLALSRTELRGVVGASVRPSADVSQEPRDDGRQIKMFEP